MNLFEKENNIPATLLASEKSSTISTYISLISSGKSASSIDRE